MSNGYDKALYVLPYDKLFKTSFRGNVKKNVFIIIRHSLMFDLELEITTYVLKSLSCYYRQGNCRLGVIRYT